MILIRGYFDEADARLKMLREAGFARTNDGPSVGLGSTAVEATLDDEAQLRQVLSDIDPSECYYFKDASAHYIMGSGDIAKATFGGFGISLSDEELRQYALDDALFSENASRQTETQQQSTPAAEEPGTAEQVSSGASAMNVPTIRGTTGGGKGANDQNPPGSPAKVEASGGRKSLDEETLFKALEENQQKTIAGLYFAQRAQAENIRIREDAVPESTLSVVKELPSDAQQAYYLTIVNQRLEVEEERLRLLKLARLEREDMRAIRAEVGNEMTRQMRRWTRLSQLAPWFLLGTSLFAVMALIYILQLIALKIPIDGVSVALIIFSLALFAVSPAVLLLLERPLKGIDEYKPGAGEAKEEEKPKTPTATPEAAKEPKVKKDKKPAKAT